MNYEVKIWGKIDEESGNRIIEDLIKAVKDEDSARIVLLINSPGGNVGILTPIWEIIRMTKKEVVAVGMEKVCSAATSIFMMAKRRILFPNTEFLIHKAGAYIHGGEDHIHKAAEGAKKATQIAWKPIIDGAKVTKKLLSTRCRDDKDWILTDKEIEEYGIITEAYDREKVKELII